MPAELPVGYVYQKFLDEMVKYPNTPQEVILCQKPFGVHNVPLYRSPQALPVGEGASVPAELDDDYYKAEAERFYNWMNYLPGNLLHESVVFDYAGVCNFKHAIASQLKKQFANKAVAYGREQAQSGVMLSHDEWAELVARHPETMQILFGGAAMTEQDVINLQYATAQDQACMAIAGMLKPRIFIDGNRWCVLWGEDLQSGVAGFGKTPMEAMCDFNNNWYAKLSEPPTC